MPSPAIEPSSPRANSLAQATWDLGRGTLVRIRDIGEVVDLPGGDGTMRLDYGFARRGRMSRNAVRKFLQRLVLGSLVCKMVETDPTLGAQWARRAARERRWLDRHLKLAFGVDWPCA